MSKTPRETELEQTIARLERELAEARGQQGGWVASGNTVRVPDSMREIFDQAQKTAQRRTNYHG